MILTTEKLEIYILDKVKKLGNVSIEEYYFNNDTHNQEGVYIFSDELRCYHFVVSERGSEVLHKVTDNIFEITFWTLESITFSMADRQTQSGDKYRERLLNNQLELLGLAGENYKKIGEAYTNELLNR